MQQQPLHPSYNNGISYNGVDQETAGQTVPQQNQSGVPYANLNSSYTMNYGRGGGQMVYNPPVTTQPYPNPTPVYHGGTAAPPIPSYAVPNGRPQNAGLTPYTLANGTRTWNAGYGGGSFNFGPNNGGVAYHPSQQFGGMLQGLNWQGMGQHPNYGFRNRGY